MQIGARILLLIGMAALMTGCDWDEIGSFGDSHAYEKPFHDSHPLKPGGRLTVENFNGSIEISGWDQDRVEIEGVQYASTPELRDAIKIEVSGSSDSIQIRTIRPGGRYGNMGVKYIIKAPRKVDLDRIVSSNGSVKASDIEGVIRLRTTNGSVRAARVRGNLEATTSNGGVDVEELDGPATIRTTNGRVSGEAIRGTLQVSTSNGSIHARLLKAEPHRPVRLQTTNGAIDLTMDSLDDNEVRASTTNGGIMVKLPARAGAHVHAHTSHSSIHTDFDVRHDGAEGKHYLDGDRRWRPDHGAD